MVFPKMRQMCVNATFLKDFISTFGNISCIFEDFLNWKCHNLCILGNIYKWGTIFWKGNSKVLVCNSGLLFNNKILQMFLKVCISWQNSINFCEKCSRKKLTHFLTIFFLLQLVFLFLNLGSRSCFSFSASFWV